MLVLGLCPKGFVENQEEPVSSQASFVALGCQTQQESKQNQGKEAQDGTSRPLDQRAEEWLLALRAGVKLNGLNLHQ